MLRLIGPLLLLTLATLTTGCETTTVRFENQLPGVRLHNLRWTTSNQAYVVEGALLPGQTSTKVDIYVPDEGKTGQISFEVELNGRRVALVTEESLKIEAEEQARIVIGPDTPVRHPLLAEAPMALWVADVPEE